MTKTKKCTHLAKVDLDMQPRTPDGCEECLALGDAWVELRLCLSCGHVGCCNDSKNKHATKHFKTSKHPIIKSYKSKTGQWMWCYVDEIYL